MQMANFLCNILKKYTEETLVRNITAMFREQCPTLLLTVDNPINSQNSALRVEFLALQPTPTPSL